MPAPYPPWTYRCCSLGWWWRHRTRPAARSWPPGYERALYDGVNDFHCSADHLDLLPALAAPANITDAFLRASASPLAERLAVAQATLAAAEARVEGSSQRLLDALQTAGVARDDSLRKAEEFAWLRGLIAEAKQAADTSRAESLWLREQMDAVRATETERSSQLLARAEESAWLRGCLADAEARIASAEARIAGEVRARADSEGRAHDAAMELRALRTSTSWRVTAPLRRLRAGEPPLPAATPAVVAAPVVHVTVQPPAKAEPLTVTSARQVGGARPHLNPLPPAGEGENKAIAVAARLPVAAAPRSPRLPVATVHQFHAGSAAGDAITNSMLLIRALLRGAGFRSDIFVETRGPGLGSDVMRLDSMPEHDGYVLLVHHSMGFPSFDRVLAMPARKVLMYHNITPPEMLAGIPRIQRMAELGREQLAALAHQVAFALADSDYNAVELHRLGFPAVRTCPLLFDVAALTRRATGIRPGDGVFTVLFVGRVTPSKAQDDLVDAFAAFRDQLGQPCRLVLAGALDADEHAFITRVRARIAAAGLDGSVHLTGLVSDRELHDWYRQADLYVSLSRHEGFGVPLVEAMAHGVPVVAWPTGAVPFTLGGTGTLLPSRDPQTVAAAMITAADDLTRLAALGTKSLARWDLDRQMPLLMEALATAGAVPPLAGPSQDAIAANLQVTICGHVAKSYSLAAVNRCLARTIEAQRPGTVRLIPVEAPDMDQAFVATLAARGRPETGPELVLSGHYPLHIPSERGDLLAALVFWEETLLPPATVATLNGSFDAVFAPSRSVAKALVDSGVSIPVLNLGHAPDLAPFAALDPARQQAGPFTFLHVSSAFPRKGLDVLLAAWVCAFAAADPVRLVIKTFPNPHNDAEEQVARLRTDHPDAAAIELLDKDLPPDAMPALYGQANAMVLPSRGEGYNLPAAEAMAASVPVIVTAAGGHTDFCTPATARLIARRFARSASHVAAPHSLWVEPDARDLAAALREAASGALDGLAAPARHAILAHADPAAFTGRLTRAAAGLLLTPKPPPLRLTWVTSWNIRCGIAEYSRNLLEALDTDGLPQPTILADERTLPGTGARTAWRLGDAASVEGLLAAVAKADGDVTMIQHQPMLLEWPSLARLLDGMAEAGRITVVTLHNTRHLLDIAKADRAAAVGALGRTARVLVHTLADVERLDALGLSGVTTLLPHPAPAPATAPTRPLPEDAVPVIGCTGFFLPGKGIDVLIAATARLRKRWPGVRLRLVNAEYDDPASTAEIARCQTLARDEGLAVEWHTGFVSAAEQLAALRGCDLIVMPYQASKEAASGAVRAALATGIPVAVTPLPLFDEAAGAVFRLPGTDAAPMELGIASVLGSVERRTALARAAQEWLAERSFPATARRLHGMLLGLAAQARMGQPADGSLWQE